MSTDDFHCMFCGMMVPALPEGGTAMAHFEVCGAAQESAE